MGKQLENKKSTHRTYPSSTPGRNPPPLRAWNTPRPPCSAVVATVHPRAGYRPTQVPGAARVSYPIGRTCACISVASRGCARRGAGAPPRRTLRFSGPRPPRTGPIVAARWAVGTSPASRPAPPSVAEASPGAARRPHRSVSKADHRGQSATARCRFFVFDFPSARRRYERSTHPPWVWWSPSTRWSRRSNPYRRTHWRRIRSIYPVRNVRGRTLSRSASTRRAPVK